MIKIFFSDWTGVIKKQIQEMANQHIITSGPTIPLFIKISHFQNLHVCRFDLMRISRSCKTSLRLTEIQAKIFKQLLWLYQLGRDKKRKD